MTTPFIPLDGRITSLQVLPLALNGVEVMEIVSPGNAKNGNNYQVTTAVLAAFFGAFPYVFGRTEVLSGLTYDIVPTDTQVLVNKGIGSPTSIVAPLAASMAYPFPVLIKDFNGDAGNNLVTISFTGGELCDGLTELTIGNPYGWVTINPNPGGGGWYQS